MVQYVKLRSEGGSRVVTIPRPIVDALFLTPGDTLRVAIVGEQILLSRVKSEEEALAVARRGEKG